MLSFSSTYLISLGLSPRCFHQNRKCSPTPNRFCKNQVGEGYNFCPGNHTMQLGAINEDSADIKYTKYNMRSRIPIYNGPNFIYLSSFIGATLIKFQHLMHTRLLAKQLVTDSTPCDPSFGSTNASECYHEFRRHGQRPCFQLSRNANRSQRHSYRPGGRGKDRSF